MFLMKWHLDVSRNIKSGRVTTYTIVLRSSNLKLPLGDAAILPIHQQ